MKIEFTKTEIEYILSILEYQILAFDFSLTDGNKDKIKLAKRLKKKFKRSA